jgi:hypothetical protein
VLEDVPRFCTVGFGLIVKFAEVIVEPVSMGTTGVPFVTVGPELDRGPETQEPPVGAVVLHVVPFVLYS